MKNMTKQPDRMINYVNKYLRTLTDEEFLDYYKPYINSYNYVIALEIDRRFLRYVRKNNYK